MAVTINVNGLDAVKWKKIKISLNADTNVIALQETHCDVQRANTLEEELDSVLGFQHQRKRRSSYPSQKRYIHNSRRTTTVQREHGRDPN